MTPQRVQRRRTRGWRMPPGAVYVGRPTEFGNPFRVGFNPGPPIYHVNALQAVALYKALIEHSDHWLARIRSELTGRDLVCWCPLGAPCHADVLLEVANA